MLEEQHDVGPGEGCADFGLIPVAWRSIVMAAVLLGARHVIISWPATPSSSSSADLKPFLVIPSRTQFRVKFTGYRAGEGGPLPFPT